MAWVAPRHSRSRSDSRTRFTSEAALDTRESQVETHNNSRRKWETPFSPLIEQVAPEGPPLLERVIGGALATVHGRNDEEGKESVGDPLDETGVATDGDAL
jgi:hypothetical protein